MIVIDGIPYEVGIHETHLEGHGNILFGYVDYDKTTISLRAGMAKERLESTLIHEILHPMFLTEDRIMEEDKESVVGRLADKIYTTFKTNGLFSEGWAEKLIDTKEDVEERSERVQVDYGVQSDAAEDESVR